MPANFGKPVVTDLHVEVLAQLRENITSVGQMCEPIVPDNPPEGLKRWNATAKKWQQLVSNAWADLCDVFEITVRNALKLGGRDASDYWHTGNLQKNEFSPASTTGVAQAAASTATAAANAANAANAAAASASAAAANAAATANSATATAASAIAARISLVGAIDKDESGNVLSPVPPSYVPVPGRFTLQLQALTPSTQGFSIALVRVWTYVDPGPPSGSD